MVSVELEEDEFEERVSVENGYLSIDIVDDFEFTKINLSQVDLVNVYLNETDFVSEIIQSIVVFLLSLFMFTNDVFPNELVMIGLFTVTILLIYDVQKKMNKKDQMEIVVGNETVVIRGDGEQLKEMYDSFGSG